CTRPASAADVMSSSTSRPERRSAPAAPATASNAAAPTAACQDARLTPSPCQSPPGTNVIFTLRPFIAVMPAAGPRRAYNGEWAGAWENGLIDETVPWVDASLPTIATPEGRVIAGLSAGGFGAVDIALRHPGTFGSVESWSGYF